MSKIFRDSESLEKSAGKKLSQNWKFLLESGLKSPRKKSFVLLILPYKTWWKPRFPMDWRPLVKGYIANFSISLDGFEFFRFGLFFPFLIFFPVLFFFSFCVFLVHPTLVSVLLSASVKRFDVSRMRDFLFPSKIVELQGDLLGLWLVICPWRIEKHLNRTCKKLNSIVHIWRFGGISFRPNIFVFIKIGHILENQLRFTVYEGCHKKYIVQHPAYSRLFF